MMRYLKLLFLSTVVFGLMVGSAWAGALVSVSTPGADPAAVPIVYAQEMVNPTLTTQVPNNLISLELRGTEAIPAAAGYTFRCDLPAGTTFTSTNANYALASFGLLAIGVPLLQAGGINQSFIVFSFNVAGAGGVNDNLQLTSADPGGLRISNSSLAVAGTSINLTCSVRNSGNVLMSSASLAFMNSTWGFEVVTNSPVNGNGFFETIAASTGRRQFRVGGVLQNFVNDALIVLPPVVGTVQGDGVTPFALVAADRINLTITGDMTSVTNVWFDANGNGVLDVGERTATIAGNTATFTGIPGTDPLTLVPTPLAARVDGVNVVENRIWRLSASLDMSDPAFNDHTNMAIRRTPTAIVGGVVTLGIVADGIYNWAHDGYMGVVPYLSTNATVPSVCIVNNASAVVGSVYLDVLSSEGAVVTTNLLLGTIGAQTTARLDFAGTNTTLAGFAAVPIPLMTADRRYAGRIIVAADGALVYIMCMQTDPVQGKRVLPVLTQQPWGW